MRAYGAAQFSSLLAQINICLFLTAIAGSGGRRPVQAPWERRLRGCDRQGRSCPRPSTARPGRGRAALFSLVAYGALVRSLLTAWRESSSGTRTPWRLRFSTSRSLPDPNPESAGRACQALASGQAHAASLAWPMLVRYKNALALEVQHQPLPTRPKDAGRGRATHRLDESVVAATAAYGALASLLRGLNLEDGAGVVVAPACAQP